MHKILLITIVFLLNAGVGFCTPDSISVQNNNGKRLVIHRVDAADTYYSIAKRYNVPVGNLTAFNKNIPLLAGAIIKVPTSIPFASLQPTNPAYGITNTHINSVAHIVARGETITDIAAKYNTTVQAIRLTNNLKTNKLKTGTRLQVEIRDAVAFPDTNTAVVAQVNKDTVTKYQPQRPIPRALQPEPPVYHIVRPNETIYSIATLYKVDINTFKHNNHIENGVIFIGQRLLVKGDENYTPTNASDTTAINSLKDPQLRMSSTRYGLHEVEEKGVAVYIDDKDLDGTKMFALHRTAPIGSVVKISNPMTNRTTFAKVVGRFTENATTKDVVVVLTKAVSDSLGALDKRFQCVLAYGVPNEQQ